jgi:FtsH-binding integral membrane protein
MSRWDSWGLLGSTLCLVHCAVLAAWPLLWPLGVGLLTVLQTSVNGAAHSEALVVSRVTPLMDTHHGHFWFHLALAFVLGAVAWLSVAQRLRGMSETLNRTRVWLLALVTGGFISLLAGAVFDGSSLGLTLTVLGSLSLLSVHIWNRLVDRSEFVRS